MTCLRGACSACRIGGEGRSNRLLSRDERHPIDYYERRVLIFGFSSSCSFLNFLVSMKNRKGYSYVRLPFALLQFTVQQLNIHWFKFSRASETPLLGSAGHRSMGESPGLILGDEQLQGGLSEIHEKDTRSATAYHACKDVTSCLSQAFLENSNALSSVLQVLFSLVA